MILEKLRTRRQSAKELHARADEMRAEYKKMVELAKRIQQQQTSSMLPPPGYDDLRNSSAGSTTSSNSSMRSLTPAGRRDGLVPTTLSAKSIPTEEMEQLVLGWNLAPRQNIGDKGVAQGMSLSPQAVQSLTSDTTSRPRDSHSVHKSHPPSAPAAAPQPSSISPPPSPATVDARRLFAHTIDSSAPGTSATTSAAPRHADTSSETRVHGPHPHCDPATRDSAPPAASPATPAPRGRRPPAGTAHSRPHSPGRPPDTQQCSAAPGRSVAGGSSAGNVARRPMGTARCPGRGTLRRRCRGRRRA
ncbi:hypothetical protein BP5796_04225 [Coleophoma crateriformis]|uniref:Uncharacterized protein n=1 Tax=Coleophoma crateriformis TaxID=565419 RepID=A0A3D8SHV3_9HELO|nr:hypothetical protein BP5796_04225 [Coleophoma crateriformis]